MDPVTQAALGAACSQAVLHRYDKKNAWLVGALSAMAPDLDILIRSTNDPMMLFIYHRQFTHSLIFIPIGALIVALALMIFKRFRVSWRLTLFASLIGYGTHAILDACTTYGTVLLWPFSYQRFAWDVISIIDPLFTLCLISGVYLTIKFDTAKWVLSGLILAGMLLMFNGLQHQRAIDAAHAYASEHALSLKRVRALPALLSSTRWRAVGFTPHELFIAEIKTPVFSSSKVGSPRLFTKFQRSDLPGYIYHQSEQLRDFNVFNWFSDGYLLVAQKHPLVLVDARYLRRSPLTALWGIEFNPNDNHVTVVRNRRLQ